MRDEFKQYIISLYKDIPQEVYEGLLSVFCLGLVFFALRAMKSIVIGPKCGRNTYGMIQSLFYQRGLYNRDLQVMESSCPLR